MRKTTQDIKNQDTPIVCLTAYSAPIAAIADRHCDLLLVGDTVAMVLYGDENTRSADLTMMIRHGKTVVRAAQNAVVIVDMPYGTYENDPVKALENAQSIIDETGCDGVKLEGGQELADTIAYLTANDIEVMAHIGLLPQSVENTRDYKVQGKDEEAAAKLLADAKAVEEAGAFSVVIEAVPEPLAALITQSISIPTIGIGASSACNGQILVNEDMLGLSLGHVPKFVKQYGDIKTAIDEAIKTYAKEVLERSFPAEKHTYKATKNQELKKAS